MVEVRQVRDVSIPEISAEEADTYHHFDPNKIYGVGCGDDRPATPESLALLPEDVEKDGTMVRYYGGIWGVSRVLAVAIAQAYGVDAVKNHFSNNFVDFSGQVKNRIEAVSNLRFTVHSAEGNEEGEKDGLNLGSEKGVGCAYAALIGGVSALNSDEHVTLIATKEARELGDDEVEAKFTSIVRANKDVFGLFFNDDSAAALTRNDFVRSGMPSLILEGSHRHIADGAKAVINFQYDKVSNPKAAEAAGGKFYNNDVTIFTEAIIRAFPELKLDPRMVLDIMIEDIAATRQALAGHENLNAEDLRPSRYGEYATALQHLRSVASELY